MYSVTVSNRSGVRPQSQKGDNMILADKIIELRKRAGWSQEDLAEKLDVSRQSISKWESAQSVPDMNKIIRLSELFGVSTDYLLKDNLELEPVAETEDTYGNELYISTRSVSMEEASSFLDFRNTFASRISLGVMMCILSPILVMLLSVASEEGFIRLSDAAATGIGLLYMFILIGSAVALFVTSGLANSKYEYIEKEMIDTMYGVDGMVRDRRDRFKGIFTSQLTVGIVMCVVSVIPIFIALIIFGDDGNDFYFCVAAAVLLVLVAVGVFLIVRVSVIWGGMQMLLEEGGYSRAQKAENRKDDPVAGVYWGLVTAGYLAYSFITGRWDRSWIVWPVAGVLYGALVTVLHAIRSKA